MLNLSSLRVDGTSLFASRKVSGFSIPLTTSSSLLFLLIWTSFGVVTADVCIVGGGLAGLSAAAELQKNGVSFKLIEASDRLGGRVYPIEYENNTLQLGAEYINGKRNEMYRIASRLGLISGQESDYSIYENNPSIITGSTKFDPELLRTWTEFVDPLEDEFYENSDEESAVTIGELFQSKYALFIKKHEANRKIFDQLAKTYINYYESEWSADVNKLALANFHIWDDKSNSETSYTMRGRGFGAILDDITKKIPAEHIRLNSEVTKIEWHASPIRVSLSTKEVVECDTVLLTVPLGVLKENNILMVPEFDDKKKQVIENLGFGRLEKLFLVYEEPWWDVETSHYITLNLGEEYKSFTSSIRGFEGLNEYPNIIMIWISGEGPAPLAALTDGQIKEQMTTFLRNQMNNASIPEPSKVIIHKWLADKFTKGAYTYMTPDARKNFEDPFEEMARPLKFSNKIAICFAGEHTHSTFYQTTSGAYESGLREANRIIKKLKKE